MPPARKCQGFAVAADISKKTAYGIEHMRFFLVVKANAFEVAMNAG
ncbi:hypothetical protein SAMN05216326_11235 [Nitrosomonas marina]|uniref:Uncharacterized protein n=1 Tax=Nitrosomonas marina TaxID=917 RepID=A0A1I0BXQ1_9PROT|nr:hypothetical protein SAMN05216326_11235 [Nitrosomonas marina]